MAASPAQTPSYLHFICTTNALMLTAGGASSSGQSGPLDPGSRVRRAGRNKRLAFWALIDVNKTCVSRSVVQYVLFDVHNIIRCVKKTCFNRIQVFTCV